MSPAINKSFKFDVFIRASSDLIVTAFSLIILSIIAKNLHAVGYGIYGQIMATVTFITPLLLLRLPTACVRYFPRIVSNKFKIKRYFVSMLVLIWATTIIIIVTPNINKSVTSWLMFGTGDYANLVGFVTIFVFLYVSSIFIQDFYRAINKIKNASLYGVIRTGLYLISLLITLYKMKMGVKGLLFSYCFAELSVIVLMTISIYKRDLRNTPTRLDFSWMSEYLKYSLPLVPYTALVWVNHLGDRYLITHMIGLKEAGIYAVSYSISSLAFFLHGAISYVIFPHISLMWSKGQSNTVKSLLQKGQNLFLFQAIPIALGLTVLSPYIIRIIAGEDFFVGRTMIFLIATGYIFLGIFRINGYVIDLSEKTILFLIILIITASINIGLNLIFIPMFKLNGAALSTFITYSLQCIILFFLSPRIVSFKIDFDLKFLMRCTIAAIIMAIFINFFYINNIIDIILVAFLGFAVYIIIMYVLTGGFKDYDFGIWIKNLRSRMNKNKGQ